MKRSGALALFPLLAFAGLALALGKGVNQPAEPAFVGQLDRPLPEFDLSPLPGTESGFSSQDLEGKVVLINVFASWCSVCRAEHDKLLDLAASQPVPVYGVNWKDAKGAGTLFLNRFGNPYIATGRPEFWGPNWVSPACQRPWSSMPTGASAIAILASLRTRSGPGFCNRCCRDWRLNRELAPPYGAVAGRTALDNPRPGACS